MLTLREKVIVLYATAPDGFTATRAELCRKFEADEDEMSSLMHRMALRGIISLVPPKSWMAGQAIRDEIGAAG